MAEKEKEREVTHTLAWQQKNDGSEKKYGRTKKIKHLLEMFFFGVAVVDSLTPSVFENTEFVSTSTTVNI